MACPAVPCFSTLSRKRRDFRKTFTEYKMCVLIFSTTFVWNISHSKKKSVRYDQKCILVACPAVPGFSTLSPNRRDFRKTFTENKMCVFIFSTTFVWIISHFKKNSARYYHKCISVFMWSTGYSCPILMKLEFSEQILKKILKISNLMEICRVGAELFDAGGRTDGRTDMTKLIVAFHNLAKKVHKYKNEIIFRNDVMSCYTNNCTDSTHSICTNSCSRGTRELLKK